MAIHKETHNNESNSDSGLIPGLPDEIAELCLLHVPYPYQTLSRSVSSSWNRAITNPSFSLSKKSLSLSKPYLFVLASHKSTATIIQWQALDPSSGRWFLLPPMPTTHVQAEAFACAALPRHGELFVIGGNSMRSQTHTPMHSTFVYRTSTNQWSQSSPMPTARSFLTAEQINGKIIAIGGTGTASDSLTDVEIYHPETDTWQPRANTHTNMTRYDSAVVGGKVYVTEGWKWPFMFSPRGGVYDEEKDTWREMKVGMREGWTGLSGVVRGKVMVVSEYGDCPVKVYDEDDDTWDYVGGDTFPRGLLQRPLVVRGSEENRLYVVSCNLNVGIGTVEIEYDKDKAKDVLKLTWQVIQAPKAFAHLTPSHSQLLFA